MTTTHVPPRVTPPGARRPRWPYVAATILFAIGALVLVSVRDTDDDQPAPPVSSSVPATATTATTGTTTPPTITTAGDSDQAVFPVASSELRFQDPLAVATAFATDLVGFTDAIIGEYRAGDSRSGEVEVRASTTGPVTTVLVRQLDGDEWWVIGSGTAAIQITEPAALDAIRSPVRLQGRSTAFEATVDVTVLEDGSDVPIGRGWVMGGANGEMAAFDGRVDFSVPSTSHGVVILSTSSMEDGRVWEASTVRVRFVEASACGGLAAPAVPSADEIAVRVFFTCGDDIGGTPAGLVRVVPRTAGVLRAALDELLEGPTAAERDAGFTSWFSDDTRGMVDSVDLSETGHAVVDFDDLRPVIPSASASAGSQLLLSQLDATVFQFPTVETVEYRIGDDCHAFFEWLQLAGCDPRREST